MLEHQKLIGEKNTKENTNRKVSRTGTLVEALIFQFNSTCASRCMMGSSHQWGEEASRSRALGNGDVFRKDGDGSLIRSSSNSPGMLQR